MVTAHIIKAALPLSHPALHAQSKHMVSCLPTLLPAPLSALLPDMHIFLFSVDSALAGVNALLADIDVGKEPVAYCLMSPDGNVILSCDDDGQLETWSVKTRERRAASTDWLGEVGSMQAQQGSWVKARHWVWVVVVGEHEVASEGTTGMGGMGGTGGGASSFTLCLN